MHQSENKAAEQCPACAKRVKRKPRFVFSFWLGAVRLLVSLFALSEKYGKEILGFFGLDLE